MTDQPKRISPLHQREDGTYEHVPATPEIVPNLTISEHPIPLYKFVDRPERIDFGTVAVCPRCHSRTKKVHYGAQGSDAKHQDPYKKGPCLGCNGWGIVPNKGPIALTPPE